MLKAKFEAQLAELKKKNKVPENSLEAIISSKRQSSESENDQVLITKEDDQVEKKSLVSPECEQVKKVKPIYKSQAICVKFIKIQFYLISQQFITAL